MDKVKTPEILPFEDLTVKDGYVPEGFDSAEEFLADMREEYLADVAFDKHNRDDAQDDKLFWAGQHWDPVVKEQRLAQGLPCLTIHSVPQFIGQLVGDWRENKRGIKVVPTEDGDADKASVRGDLIRSIENQSRADRVYDAAFESTVACGEGAFRVAVEYARDDVFDQDIFIREIEDAQSVVWDRMSTDITGRDARRCFVDDLVPKKYFKKTWPKANPDDLGQQTYQNLTAGNWIQPEGYRVTEYWRLIERERLLGLFSDGSIRVIEDNYDELVNTHGPIVRTRLAPCTYAQMHLVTGFAILAGPYEYRLTRLPIIRMTGRVVPVSGQRVRYGLIRWMKDPVRLRDFNRSVAAEQLGYAPKAQWIATESAIEGYEDKFRQAHLSRDPILKVSDEAVIGQNIQRLDPPVWQSALHQEAQANVQDMKDVTGIHDASLGIRSNETSGKAINARQREGDIAALTYYDNGNASVLEAGDVVNQLISQIYDATRIIRIIGEDEKVKFLKINDPADPESPDMAVGRYDVALSTGASYTTRRVEAAQAMMDAVQVWPQLMQVAGDLIAKAQNWPGADELAERLKKTVPAEFLDEDDRTAPDPAMQEAQAAIQALQAENAKLQDQMGMQAKKLIIDAYNAQTQRIRALSDNMVDADNKSIPGIPEILQDGVDIDSALAEPPELELEEEGEGQEEIPEELQALLG